MASLATVVQGVPALMVPGVQHEKKCHNLLLVGGQVGSCRARLYQH